MTGDISPNHQGMASNIASFTISIITPPRFLRAHTPSDPPRAPKLSNRGPVQSYCCTFSNTPGPISPSPPSPLNPLHRPPSTPSTPSPPPPLSPHSLFHHNHHHNHNQSSISIIYIMISPKYSLAPSPLPLLAFGLAYLTELFNLMLAMIAPGCSTGSLPLLYNASLTHTEWNP